jgi:hypothetical protein
MWGHFLHKKLLLAMLLFQEKTNKKIFTFGKEVGRGEVSSVILILFFLYCSIFRPEVLRKTVERRRQIQRPLPAIFRQIL